MEIIEQIGSYAGLAAIVGLAILSALYFSQARDVRRLREAEEGRSPQPAPAPGVARGPQRPGAARPAAAGAVASQGKPAGPQAAPGQAKPAQPAPAQGAPGQPAPAKAAGEHAEPKPTPDRPAPGVPAPAPAGPGAPAPASSPGGAPAPGPPPAGAPAPPPGAPPPGAPAPGGPKPDAPAPRAPAPGAPAPATAAAAQSQPAAVARKDNGQGGPQGGSPEAPAAEQAGPAASATRERPAAPPTEGEAAPSRPAAGVPVTQRPLTGPGRPPARPGAARGLPPLPASAQAKAPWYRRLAPRYIVLLVAGALVLATGAAFGVATLAGEDAAPTSDQPERAGSAAEPLDPSTIEVAVLNGTSVSGAAESVSGTVEQAGFQIGNVANATEQTSAESAVLFADGARRAAREVGRELGVSQLEPIDTDTQSLAGTADVVVIVGADQAD